MQMIISTQGTVHCLYNEAMDLGCLGRLRITRGSYVEPTLEGLWTVDLSPVKGPVLGPYRSRVEALIAEVKWLEDHWLLQAGE